MITDVPLPGDLLGEYDAEANLIQIDPRVSDRSYRCTLAHEWEHWRADHRPIGDLHFDAMLEAEAAQLAARKLIDIRHLAEAAAAYAGDPARIAEELHVDLETLRVRCEHLHPSERAFLQRRLEHTEESA